ncbi:WD40 repeat domain-containing protein [Methanoregula sp.]|uniref:WD40 repeat domain-containing protein n=1 Tax=Methanoregula sp. TaxID=2052170 RepID=UPI003C7923B8
MHTGSRIHLFASALLLATFLIGTVAGISLGVDWKQAPPTTSPFAGVAISSDGNTVYGGGNQMLVRNWDGSSNWGGRSGFVAAMSADGGHVVSTLGNSIVLLDNTGVVDWTRSMGASCTAVAISSNGSFVVSADEQGNMVSWSADGEFWGRNITSPAKRIAIAPTGDLVVATTDSGLQFYTPALDPVWTDSRSGSLDDFIVISSDGSTIITAGGTRLSSHTNTGVLNWQVNVAKDAITDIAANDDCSIILVASKDNSVRAVDRYGTVHWTFDTGQWANAVSASRDGSVIGVGSNDGTIFVLDHGGDLLTKRSSGTAIQPRSLAVSRDGSRIAAADQYNLYGYTLLGNSPGSSGSDTTYIEAGLNPVKTTAPPSPSATVTTPAEGPNAGPQTTTVPAPATTRKSPAEPWLVVPAAAAALWLAGKR